MNSTFDPKGEAVNFNTVAAQEDLKADIEHKISLIWGDIIECQRRLEVLYHAVNEDTQYEALEKIDHLKDDLGDIERATEDFSAAIDDLDLTEEKAGV